MARALLAALGRPGYAHMCRDGHVQIGHNDSEHEMCPLCRALADRDHWREARRAAMEAGEILRQRAEDAEQRLMVAATAVIPAANLLLAKERERAEAAERERDEWKQQAETSEEAGRVLMADVARINDDATAADARVAEQAQRRSSAEHGRLSRIAGPIVVEWSKTLPEPPSVGARVDLLRRIMDAIEDAEQRGASWVAGR